MKAILEFNLPEDASLHRSAVQAQSLKSILMELDNELRNDLKHDDGMSSDEQDTYIRIRERLHQLCREHGVDIIGE